MTAIVSVALLVSALVAAAAWTLRPTPAPQLVPVRARRRRAPTP